MTDLLYKSCLVDLRGVDGWTKSQRQRKADIALVSPTLRENPLVLMENVGIHTAPGWNEYGGNPPTAGSFYAAVREIAREHPFPDGQPMILWSGGGNVLYGLNLASPGCARELALVLSMHCAWARGVCFDYFTTLGWLLAERPGGMPAWATVAWFADFDAGLRALALNIREFSPRWFVYGYQYHETPSTSALDGPFVEDRYTRNFPTVILKDYIDSIAADRATVPTGILEMRVPSTFSPERTAEIEAACAENGWYLSKGKDAYAIGTP